MAMQQQEVLIRNGYDIGIGVASTTGSPMALGVKGEVSPPQIGTGGSGSFTFRRIDDHQDLEKELRVGADASGGIGLFSGSASFDFAQRCRIQSSSLCVLVSAEEVFAFQQIDSPELTTPAATLVKDGLTERFLEQFGEYFVRGVSTGGRFVGVIRIDTQSSTARTDVDASLSGSYGLMMSGEARLHLSNTLKTAKAKIQAFYIFDGGQVTTRLTSNDPVELVEQLYAAMDEWTATVRDQPKAFGVTLAPYVIALGPNPPNIVDFEHQRDVLIRCAKLRSNTLDKLNLVDYMLDPNHREEFQAVPPPEGPDLPALQAALGKDLDVIADAASFAINNMTGARDPIAYMAEINGVPGYRFTQLPENLPAHTGPVPPTTMPNLVGLPFEPIAAIHAGIAFGKTAEEAMGPYGGFGNDTATLGPAERPVAEFLFAVKQINAIPDIRYGNFPPAGAVILTQTPAPGGVVLPGTVYGWSILSEFPVGGG